MTEQAATTERLSEVTRLATLLADRVLDAQIMSRPIADVQIRALLDAALVLEQRGSVASLVDAGPARDRQVLRSRCP
jgi:hypothetical protein